MPKVLLYIIKIIGFITGRGDPPRDPANIVFSRDERALAATVVLLDVRILVFTY